MGNYKPSSILIGLVLVGLFTSVIFGFVSQMAENYNINYDNISENKFNYLKEISNDTETMETNLKNMANENTGVIDLLGLLFQNAYLHITTSFKGAGYMSQTATTAMSETDVAYAGVFSSSIITIISIIVVFGILLTILLKWES